MCLVGRQVFTYSLGQQNFASLGSYKYIITVFHRQLQKQVKVVDEQVVVRQ